MLSSKKAVKNKFSDNKTAWLLLISCWLVYIAMMAGKSIYNAEIIEIMKQFGVSKAVAGYATTAYYFTYGFMQLVIAKLLPKINLRKYLAVTLSLSAISTALVGAATQIWHIWILLGLNGIFHAAVWPSCVLVVSKYLPSNMQTTANGLLSTGFAIGFIMSYLFSALFIEIASWTVTFLVFGLLMFLPLVFFYIYLKKAENKEADKSKNEEKTKTASNLHLNHQLIKKYLRVFYVLVCITTFLANTAYYGMNNWVPSLMYDVFGMPSSISTFLSVLVPVVGLIGPFIGIFLCQKHNLWYVSIGIIAVTVILTLALAFGYSVNMVFSLVFSIAVLTLYRGAINTMGTSLVLKIRNIFNAGSFTAVVNALASLGASVAPPITGSVIDNFGRQTYYIFITVVSLITIALIIALNRLTRKIRVLRRNVLD